LTDTAARGNHAPVILTEMPDLPPRPENSRNAAFRRGFYARWHRENCVVSGSARQLEYRPIPQMLSIKSVARGTETYFVDRRRVAVNDDSWLVLNESRTYGSAIDSPHDVASFSIFFRPGIGREVAGALARSAERALDDGGQFSAPIEFDEALRPLDTCVTPLLNSIQRDIRRGERDEHWLEERCQLLVARLVAAQRTRCEPLPRQLADMRPARRAELLRRLECAVDFMHASLHCDISLADIAAAAHLSRFHFLRLFQTVNHRTPVAYLRELRTRRALALLNNTALTGNEIAARVGMSRIALWRSLRASRGVGTRALRRVAGRESAS
jgi:AraC family transcriptional regulator